MLKGEKIRLDIHNILYSIYRLDRTLNNLSIKKIINRHSKKDIALLHNVTLNSMRFHLQSSKIIKKYISKKLRDHEKILLVSAITQIVFLDFKQYAVINCSVEIAKKLNIYHGLVNSFLKKISRDKENLKNIKIEFSEFPIWFKNQAKSLNSIEKYDFLENFNKKPSLHLVFKNKQKLNEFEENLVRSSEYSGFLETEKDIKKIKSFRKGDWWVQDFSSFFPLHNLGINNKEKLVLDSCAAPGGKSFQLLSKNFRVELNDKSSLRIQILKTNLNRLNFKTTIINQDFTEFKTNKKYDFIVVDAPCSAVGTIRKNPEIFFKKNGPNFNKLTLLQAKMLDKAALLLNKDGYILYMVCSFLQKETTDQIYRFLDKEMNFKLSKFKLLNQNIKYSKLIKGNFMITLPTTINKYNIDGYFASFLKKIK